MIVPLEKNEVYSPYEKGVIKVDLNRVIDRISSHGSFHTEYHLRPII